MAELRKNTRVFISYSRRDIAFAQRLRDLLITSQFDAYLDVHDIVKGEPWRDRLRGLIESADAVVFLISPDSVASEICEWEINEAELREKRLFPVVAMETDAASIPQRLQRLNFTFLDTEPKWQKESGLLLSALREDAVWVREHTRLGELALRWERAGRPARLLLRGSDVAAAETWRDHRPNNTPELSQLHSDFLHDSRAGAQKRLRSWLIGATAVALFAVVLSTFAYRQRDLALEYGGIAEQRAAALATDVALSRADEGAVNESLLMLLDASTKYPEAAVPEKLLLALRDVTKQGNARRSFWFSATARAFHLPGHIAVFDPQAGSIFLIDPLTTDQRMLTQYGGDVVAAVMTDAGLFYLTSDEELFVVATDPAAAGEPQRLASLASGGDERLVDWSTPGMQLSSAGHPVGLRVVRSASTDKVRSKLWRFVLPDNDLERTPVPNNVGSLLGVKGDAAYFWDQREQQMSRLMLGTAAVDLVSAKAAAALGVAPCDQVIGEPSAAHIPALFGALKPGLEAVGCAGLYGDLALMSNSRALARSMMEEYFLYPKDAKEAFARVELWLANAIERLGSQGTSEPFSWYTGSAQAGLVAVSHADKVMVLGPRHGKFVKTSLYGDSDNVVAEIATPDVTDGGGFYGAHRLSFSGRDGERYRVTVIDLASGGDDQGGVITQVRPQRAYWGSCGVQRPVQDDTRQMGERLFSVRPDAEKGSAIALGDREVRIPVSEFNCASASEQRNALAVAIDGGVVIYDLGQHGRDSVEPLQELARLQDSTVHTVGFFGDNHTSLITTHDYKVVAWRPDGDGGHVADTLYRSNYPILFAEGDPEGRRLLVWLGLAQADAMVRVVPLPSEGSDWMQDGPYMLVGNPDVFFAVDGGVYRVESNMLAQLMPPVSLSKLRSDASSALSPGCRPMSDGDYRSSPCWPTQF